MNKILHWCIFDTGQKWRSKVDAADIRHEMAEKEQLPRELSKGWTGEAVIAGLHVLNLHGGNARTGIQDHDDLERFVRFLESQWGRSPTVRIRHDVFWDTFKNRGLSWREFCVLCAVYSVIGSKSYCRITRLNIRRRALGCKSEPMFDAISPKLAEKPLTASQIRTALESLENRGLFARVQASRRAVFFSHRMTADELRGVLTVKLTTPTRYTRNRVADYEFQKKIRAWKEEQRTATETAAATSPL